MPRPIWSDGEIAACKCASDDDGEDCFHSGIGIAFEWIEISLTFLYDLQPKLLTAA